MAQVDVESEMAGAIKEVLVAAGDAVSEGQELIILESMKMEIPVESPSAGTVTEVCVEPGQTIDEGQLLLRIDA